MRRKHASSVRRMLKRRSCLSAAMLHRKTSTHGDERLLCRDDARMLLLASHAVAEACRQAIAEKVDGAHEVSEKDAAEAVCQVFTNSLEYEPAMPVATACAGSAALQGVIPCRLHQERIACRDLGYKTTRRFAYSTGDGSLKLNSPRTRTKSHY